MELIFKRVSEDTGKNVSISKDLLLFLIVMIGEVEINNLELPRRKFE
jgi:hypothetical protein